MNATMIIGFRALQGIGAAVLAPNCLALLTDTFEGQARQKVIGYYASVIGAGAAIGLVIGGFLLPLLLGGLVFILMDRLLSSWSLLP